MVSVFSAGERPLLQGLARHSLGKPRFKQSTGLFEIHPLPSARSVRVFRRLRTAARALPLTRVLSAGQFAFLLREKAGPKNLSCLWQVLIGRSDSQALIYRGLHNAGLLMYCPHKMKARSGTKAAACSNRYATDKRAAAAANTDLPLALSFQSCKDKHGSCRYHEHPHQRKNDLFEYPPHQPQHKQENNKEQKAKDPYPKGR